MLRRLNPFRSLPNPREVWAWGMYDLANQSFTLLINTLLFSVYFKQVVVDDGSATAAARGDRLWSIVVPISMLIVVVVSPYLGALADGRGCKKKILISTGFICVAFTCAFGLIGPGDVALAIALYIPANIAYQIGENFLASFLPEVSTPANIGRVSAIGWTMGYVGALLVSLALLISLLIGIDDKTEWRPLFVFAGLWFLGGMIAPMIVLREAAPVATHSGATTASKEAMARLRETFADAGRYAQLLKFFAAFFTYGMGMQSVIFFAAIIATDVAFQGREDAETMLFLFTILLTISAGAGAIFTANVQDRIGSMRTLKMFLVVWMLATAGLSAYSILASRSNTPPPLWSFWIIGALVGIGLGGVGPASRATVGLFTPRHKTAEFFGLWGLVYKLAGVVGVLCFGQVKASFGNPVSLGLLFGYFAVGFLLLFAVNERRGVESARQSEDEAAAAATQVRDV